MRILGLDFGSRTVGVAVSDGLLLTAQGVETIERKDENKIIFPEFTVVDSLGISGRHFKLKAVKLMDETDVYDELVTSVDTNIYGKINEYYDGSIFILDEYVENKSLMLVSEGYIAGKKFYGEKDLAISLECISVFGNGRIEPADDFYYVGGVTVGAVKG